MVVGGGPAGMWAAKMAGRRGHRVDLYDRDEELGGPGPHRHEGRGPRRVRGHHPQREGPGGQGRRRPCTWASRSRRRRSSQENPDAVIVATGSVPIANTRASAAPTARRLQRVAGSPRARRSSARRCAWWTRTATTGRPPPPSTWPTRARPCTSSARACSSAPNWARSRTSTSPGSGCCRRACTFTPDTAVIEIAGEAAPRSLKGLNVYSNVMGEFGPYDSVVLADRAGGGRRPVPGPQGQGQGTPPGRRLCRPAQGGHGDLGRPQGGEGDLMSAAAPRSRQGAGRLALASSPRGNWTTPVKGVLDEAGSWPSCSRASWVRVLPPLPCAATASRGVRP